MGMSLCTMIILQQKLLNLSCIEIGIEEAIQVSEEQTDWSTEKG